MRFTVKMEAAVKAAGASFDKQTIDAICVIDAPLGTVWRCNGEHSFASVDGADFWHQIGMGCEPCEVTDCERCEDNALEAD